MGPAETQSGDGMAFWLELGAEIEDSEGNRLAPVALVLETYCRNPEGKHRCLELFAERGVDLPDTPPMALHRGRLDLLQAISARLQRRQELLQQAERQLNDLRASINLALPHELRTALTGILGFSELISTHSNILELTELADMGRAIYESTNRLQRLLDNYLVYARLELLAADRGQVLALRQEQTAGAGEIAIMIAESKAFALGRRDDLRMAIVDAVIAMSDFYFRKLCGELLDNAFKYSRRGDLVNLTLAVQGDWLQMTIADRGYGMTPRQVADIGAYMQFERQSFERRGVGLGLIIAKRLAEIHGGRFQLTSEAGKGDTVTVELPLAWDPID